jgi:hypothetical protein
MDGFRSTPAQLWRAFFVAAALALTAGLEAAPPRQAAPPLLQLGKPDPADARAALEQMRRQGGDGYYYLEFELRVMPRRGEEWRVPGKLWGGRNGTGPLTRASLNLPARGGEAAAERRFLIQNGRQSTVWRWTPKSGVEVLAVESLFEPLVPDTNLTPFDLQMPFIYWDDFTYEGLERFRGRPAHVLVLNPPEAFAKKYPALKGVRVHLDTQFGALVEAELIGKDGDVTKSMSVVDLKKVGEQWIVKTIDVRDERTRDKTRFAVTAAALGLDFSPIVFAPAQLAEEIRPPGGSQLVRID